MGKKFYLAMIIIACTAWACRIRLEESNTLAEAQYTLCEIKQENKHIIVFSSNNRVLYQTLKTNTTDQAIIPADFYEVCKNLVVSGICSKIRISTSLPIIGLQ